MLFSHVSGASSRRSPASPLAPPRTSSIVPSVMMNGTTRRPVTRTPFITPHAAPAAIAPAAATSGHDPPRSSWAMTTVLRAITDPTDRSIPPATITIVMPSAATHTMAAWRAISSRLAALKNCGPMSNPNRIATSTSPASTPAS